jgi:3-oxocholest-4-en-26-oyl-CoA dehydrogenase beta subunit
VDFDLTDDQRAIADLAATILGDRVTPDALRSMERAGEWALPEVWTALAKADLLGIALPEADGGGGYGLLEACLVAEQVGRHTAPVPYLQSVVGAAMPIARWGTDAQRARYLPGVVDGTTVLTVGLHEPGAATIPSLPTTTAIQRDGVWRVQGEKSFVSWAEDATAMLTTAVADGRVVVLVVPLGGPGIDLVESTAVTGEPQWTVRLDDVALDPDAVLGEDPGQGPEIVAWLLPRLATALCAAQTGVCEQALALTATHVSEREQFGTKLGTFQAVAQRTADAYIDTEAVRLTARYAAWRLDAGLAAADEVLVASYWASEGAQRVVHAAQHLHGGIGMDTDYPVHRCFRWAKVLELLLGGASSALVALGANLAEVPPEA